MITTILTNGHYPPLTEAQLADRAVPSRLYPTVREEREKRQVQRAFGLDRTAIGRGGGMPNRDDPAGPPRQRQ